MSVIIGKDNLRAESLEEILFIANFCINTRKEEINHPKFHGGIYGYPASILLLTGIESIGKYIAHHCTTEVTVDNQIEKVKPDRVFRVLNSKYFNLNLSGDEIYFLYVRFRNDIIHEATLDRVILTDIEQPKPFGFVRKNGQVEAVIVSLPALYKLCKKAFSDFIEEHLPSVQRYEPSHSTSPTIISQH